MAAEKCRRCDRTLNEGDTAWAEDWTVIDVNGTRAENRTEVRYVCDPCNSEAVA